MSEKRGVYDVGGSLPASLDVYKNRNCCLPFSHVDYEPPKPEDVGHLIELMGWSQNDTAKLAGVSWNPLKGSPTVRRWKAPSDKDSSRVIPYSAWRLLLICAGVVDIEQDLLALNHR
jgi:hypothetical protein